MDTIFEHPVFDSAREKMKRFIGQLEKPQKNLWNLCFKCGRNNVFSIAKQVRSADEGTFIFTSAEIATINGGMDDSDNAVNIWSKFEQWVYAYAYTNHLKFCIINHLGGCH